jgi:hypothetical protein
MDRLADLTAAAHDKAFIRWLGALATNAGGEEGARAFLIGRGWSQTLRVIDEARQRDIELHTKAAVAAGTARDATWAAPLVPVQLAAPFVAALQTQSLFARAGCPRVPANCGVPTDTSALLAGFAWVGEAHPKPISARVLATTPLAPTKAAVTVVITREVARFGMPGAEEFLRNTLVTEVTVGCDPASAAIVGVKPASLTNGLAAVATGATVKDTVAAVLKALFALRPAAVRPTVVLHPAICARLAGDGVFPDLTIDGGTAFGVPVVSTPGAGSGATAWIIALDAEAVAYADDGAEFNTTEHATVEMNDAPTDPPVAATVMTSLWQNDLVGLRAERHLTWKAAANSVAYAVAP